MNVFILIMTLQFNGPKIPATESVMDVFKEAYRSKETCWSEASRLEKAYKGTRPQTDVMFMCVGKGDVL